MSDAFDPQPTVATSRCRPPARAASTRRTRTTGTTRAILALVWRRLRRSLHRHDRPGAGRRCCSFMAVFADFFAPVDPKATELAFAPPDRRSASIDQDGNFSLRRASTRSARPTSSIPITFQPMIGPDYDQPAASSASSSRASPYRLFGLIPADRHFFGAIDGTPDPFPRHRQVRPRHPLARHLRLAHLADDRADRRSRIDHRRRHARSAWPPAISAAASTPGCSASSSSSSPSRNCRSISR